MSPYGRERGKHIQKNQSHILPLIYSLKDGKTNVTVERVSNSGDIEQIRAIFNEVLEEGDTYPQYGPFDLQQFTDYYLSHDAYLVKLQNESTNQNVIGSVYIKPNFPGRCSHICNGGFLVHQEYRNKGVGGVLADAFEILAVDLGYQAAFFNLVFVNNVASVRLWRSRGYQEIGRIPAAAKLKSNTEGFTDAIQFYKRFDNNNNK